MIHEYQHVFTNDHSAKIYGYSLRIGSQTKWSWSSGPGHEVDRDQETIRGFRTVNK